MLSANDSRGLALLFHLNSEPWLNQEAYSAAAHPPCFMPSPTGESQVPLPMSEPSPPMQILQRSPFVPALPGDVNSTSLHLLTCYAARTAYSTVRRWRAGAPRPAPSAGALFPFHVLVATRRVEKLQDGMYAYNGLHDRLDCLRHGRALDEVSEFILTGSFVENANLAILLVGVLDRTCMKIWASRISLHAARGGPRRPEHDARAPPHASFFPLAIRPRSSHREIEAVKSQAHGASMSGGLGSGRFNEITPRVRPTDSPTPADVCAQTRGHRSQVCAASSLSRRPLDPSPAVRGGPATAVDRSGSSRIAAGPRTA